MKLWVAALNLHFTVFGNCLLRMSHELFKSWTQIKVSDYRTKGHWSLLILLSLTDSTSETLWSVLGASPCFMKAPWRTKALLGHVGTEWGLGVSMAAALALRRKKHACLLFMESRALRKRSSDICLVTGLMAWHGSGLCQAPEETQPSPVLFCVQLLFCFRWGISSLLLHACYIL